MSTVFKDIGVKSVAFTGGAEVSQVLPMLKEPPSILGTVGRATMNDGHMAPDGNYIMADAQVLL